MSYGSYQFNSLSAVIAHSWNSWRAACDRTLTTYYNQRIELYPEGEARQYWDRLQHPQSGINVNEISDAMLSRLMNHLLQQGISKFAVDCFILELRRLRRTVAV
ncbi:MAG TPA: hypothetical protein V6C57_12130 [Coleofasciculaceae cyanobacterium]